jgi:hypothetical protein
MATLTFGDWVVLGLVVAMISYAIYLMLKHKPTAPIERMPKPSRASVVLQPKPDAAPGKDDLPMYEHVAGDLLAMADKLGNPDYTRQIEQIVVDLEARAMQGKLKYGQHLFTCNRRSMITDAYQEALDLLQYVKGIQIEAEDAGHYEAAGLAIQIQAHATSALLRLHDMVRLVKVDEKV